MKKLRMIILFLPLFFQSIGFSSFAINQNQSFRNDELDQEGENCVTFKYNDGNLTGDYHYYFDGDSTKIDELVIPKPNSQNYHKFQGWYRTKSGIDAKGNSTKVDFSSDRLSNGEVLYAKYTSYNPVSGDIKPKDAQYLYISQTLVSNCMTISTKIDIQTSDGSYDSSKYGTITTYRRPSEADTYAILDSDIVITSGGTLQIDAVLGTTGGMSQQISGAFSCLDLNGYTITVQNGGILNGYGLIFNSQKTGGIIVENEGEVLTPFCIMDYKGGGYTCTSYKNAVMTFAGYACPYLSCEMVFYAGARFKGETSLYASSSKYSTTIPLLGKDSSSLLSLSSGYMLRKNTPYLDLYLKNENLYGASAIRFDYYLNADYREELTFASDISRYVKELSDSFNYDGMRCEASLNQLTMSVSFASISLKYGDFPLPSFFSIYFYDTDFSFANSLVLLPSSYVFVDEKSTVTLSNSDEGNYKLFARISVLDEYPKYCYYFEKNVLKTTSTYLTARLIYSCSNAVIDMMGRFIFENTSNVSFDNDYSYYSIGGYINCSDQAIASLVDNQNYFKAFNYFFYPAWLSNSTYTDISAGYYSQPIISNDTVLFQIGNNRELNFGKMENDCLINYNGDTYFYKFSNQGFSQNARTKSEVMSSSAPTADAFKSKYGNLAGTFEKCSVTKINDYFEYVTVDDIKFILVNGAYLPFEEYSKEDISTIGDVVPKHTIKLTTTSHKFAMPSDSNYTNFKTGQYVEYSTTYRKWVFCLNEK